MRRAAPMGAVCVDVPPLELSFVAIPPWRSECTPLPYGQIQCNHLERQFKCDLRFAEGAHLNCLLTKLNFINFTPCLLAHFCAIICAQPERGDRSRYGPEGEKGHRMRPAKGQSACSAGKVPQALSISGSVLDGRLNWATTNPCSRRLTWASGGNLSNQAREQNADV